MINLKVLIHIIKVVLLILVLSVVGRALYNSILEVNWKVLTIKPMPVIGGIGILLSSNWLAAQVQQKFYQKFGVKLSLLQGFVLYALPAVGKYFPGKMMSVVGYTGLARTFGIPVTISSLGVVVIAVFGVMSVSLVGLISLLGYPRVFPELSRTGAGIFSFLIIFFLLLFFPAVYWRIINFCFRLLRQPTVKPDLNSGPALKMLGRVLLQNFLYFLGTALITSGIVEIPKSVFFVLVGILCIANLTGFLAFFTPAGIGVREGIILVMLTPIMGSGIAGVVAIVVRLIQTIVDVILFISALFFYRGPKNPGD